MTIFGVSLMTPFRTPAILTGNLTSDFMKMAYSKYFTSNKDKDFIHEFSFLLVNEYNSSMNIIYQ
jgi:hypothetical protein